MTRHVPTERLLGLLLPVALLASPADAGETLVYIQDRFDGAVHVLRLDPEAGQFDLIDGSPFLVTSDGGSCGGYCMTMASGKRGQQAYLFTSQDDGLVVWEIADDGGLVLVPGSPFDGGLGSVTFLGVGTVTRGQQLFVYASAFDAGGIAGFEVMEDGTLAALPGSPYATGGGPDGLDTRGQVVVVLNEDDVTVSSYKVQDDGRLVQAPGSPLAVPTVSAYNVQLDAAGRTAWVASQGGAFFGFAVNKADASLTALAGSPFTSGLVAGGAGTAPERRLLLTFDFAAPAGTADIAVHRLGKQGPDLLGRQLAGMGKVSAHAFDERRGLLVVVREGTPALVPSVRMFRVDRRSGGMLLIAEAAVEMSSVNDVELIVR